MDQQELNFIVIVVVAIIGIGIPIYVCCFAIIRTYCCIASPDLAPPDSKAIRNKNLESVQQQEHLVKVTQLISIRNNETENGIISPNYT